MEKLCLKMCEDVIKKSTLLDKTVLNFQCMSDTGDNKILVVKISTKDEELEFALELLEKETKHLGKSRDLNENIQVLIRDIDITGYDKAKFGEATVPQLILILKTVASNHAKYIKDNYGENIFHPLQQFSGQSWNQSDTNFMSDIVKGNYNEIDPEDLIQGIDKIMLSRDAVFNSSKDYVHVSSDLLQKKLFFKNSECHMVTFGRETYVPLVYDVLFTIFCFSSQKTRQHNFHKLIDYYYNTLKENLDKDGLDLTKYLPIAEYEKQVHSFNHYVKIELLKQICRTSTSSKETLDDTKYKDLLSISILEVSECILYPSLTREDCYEIVDRILGSRDWNLTSYKLIPLEERAGFLGDYFRVKLNIKFDKEEKVLHLFAKYVPTFAKVNRNLALKSFKKEEFFYRKFIPKLIDLGLEDICDFLPKCYFSRSDEVLIFEDVSISGFTSIDVNTALTSDQTKVVVKQLAKVHACTLLYEEIMTKNTKKVIRLDDEYKDYVEEMIFGSTVDKEIEEANDCASRTFLSMCDLFPEIPTRFSMEEFKRKVVVVFSTIYEKVRKSDKFRNVLCQGDDWASNILFKKNDSGEVIDCYIVDYQLTRYCPPASDLLYLIYMVTDRETRTKHSSEFLDTYYLELSRIFGKYNFDLNEVYTYENFLECCDYMRSQALTHAAIILQMVLYPSEKLMMILNDEERATRFFSKDRPELLEEMIVDGPYRRRLRGIIEDLYEYCENAL